MPLSESRFRQILREEARRLIRENVETADSKGPPQRLGPIDPKVIEAAKAKYVAAAEAFKSPFVNATIALRAVKQKYTKDKVSELSSTAMAASYIPGDMPQSRDPNAQSFKNFQGILAAGALAAGPSKLQSPTEIQKALALLAGGELAAQGKDVQQYTFNGPGILAFFVTGFEYSSADLAAWPDGKLRNEAANAVVAAVKPLANDLIRTWNALLFAMREFSRVNSQTSLGTGPVTKPVATSGYTVAAGDVISGIASRFYGSIPSNLKVAFYQQIAGNTNINSISPGQVLKLPDAITVGGKSYNINKAAPPAKYAMGKITG